MKANYKNKYNTEKQIGWTDLKVLLNGDGTYSIEPKTGIYQMKLENTSGDIHKLLKEDLIEGDDTFLVATYDHTDDSFCFEMFYSFDKFDADDYIDMEYELADYIIDQNIKKPTIFTIY